ncbi:MAG: IS91 family transposase [Paludibacteraceae bacterium]|nr:IS91 family transposase [Paludibacteraceae bacterium]
MKFYPKYLEKYTPNLIQQKVSNCIINCKTGAYGANVSICEDCGSIQIHYNSCRNRNCPMCQALPKEKWIDFRKEDVLDAPYFHLVFTVPEELNSIIYSNQKLLYDCLYNAASSTITELSGDAKYLGAKIGYLFILHTWGSEMNFHPHIHAIVLGGGLDNRNQWKDNGNDFFLPIKVISRVFKGKYMQLLKEHWTSNKLYFYGNSEKYRNHYTFKELIDLCYKKEWFPYCKKTFYGAETVIKYLGKYTHRIAISNHRIISMTDDTVTFSVKDYRNEGCWKTLTLSGVEFIRRFLMHVPPKRFVRMRHYGLLATRTKNKQLTLCRNLLGCKKYISDMREMDNIEILKYLWNIDVCSCKSCGGHILSHQTRHPLRI